MSRAVTAALFLTGWFWQFSARVNVVEVYVTVSGAANGQPVRGLQVSDFEVLEDGRAQRIDVFSAGELPLSVALAVDRSFSMSGARLAMAKSAGHVFLGALKPDDRSMIVAVGTDTEIVAPLSADRQRQHEVLAALTPWGVTPLSDAVVAAIARIETAGGRRALVLLTDGEERESAQPASVAIARAREADVLIYPVGLGPTMPALLSDLAEWTGGRAFHIRRAAALAPAVTAIAEELRYQYLLGYTPESTSGSNRRVWHTIDVRVDRPGVRVRARKGYFGGSGGSGGSM
jgi:Ca-activated chloride channel family protein